MSIIKKPKELSERALRREVRKFFNSLNQSCYYGYAIYDFLDRKLNKKQFISEIKFYFKYHEEVLKKSKKAVEEGSDLLLICGIDTFREYLQQKKKTSYEQKKVSTKTR